MQRLTLQDGVKVYPVSKGPLAKYRLSMIQVLSALSKIPSLCEHSTGYFFPAMDMIAHSAVQVTRKPGHVAHLWARDATLTVRLPDGVDSLKVCDANYLDGVCPRGADLNAASS